MKETKDVRWEKRMPFIFFSSEKCLYVHVIFYRECMNAQCFCSLQQFYLQDVVTVSFVISCYGVISCFDPFIIIQCQEH